VKVLRIIIVLVLIAAQISFVLGQQAKVADTIDPFNFQGDCQLDLAKLTTDEKTALPYVQEYAKDYKISPALIMAIMDHESIFNAGAIGDGGLAIGYMQLHWDAAYDAGYRSSRGEAKNLAREDWSTDGKNPGTNIKTGCLYLKLCYEKCSNSNVYAGDTLKNTILSYNKGWPHGPDKDNEDIYVNPIISKYNYYKQLITNYAAIAGASVGTQGTIEGLDAQTWNNKGNAFNTQGKYDEAIQCFDKAIELDPKYADAWIGKAMNLGNLGRYDEALQASERAIESNPNLASTWYEKGEILSERLGKYDEAIECFDKMIELNPNDAVAWMMKGENLDKLDKYDEAIQCWNKAIELNPQEPTLWWDKGEALKALGETTDAEVAFAKARELWHSG
jgi:tetratricopeptide (TPR) repeat protein